MAFYDSRLEAKRKLELTPKKILNIARSNSGMFAASLRYRDDWLRRRCQALVVKGELTPPRRDGNQLVFWIPSKAPPRKRRQPSAIGQVLRDRPTPAPTPPVERRVVRRKARMDEVIPQLLGPIDE